MIDTRALLTLPPLPQPNFPRSFNLQLQEITVDSVDCRRGSGAATVRARLAESGEQLLDGAPAAAFSTASALEVEAEWRAEAGGWRIVRVAALPPVVL
jgi:hypothetical protein